MLSMIGATSRVIMIGATSRVIRPIIGRIAARELPSITAQPPIRNKQTQARDLPVDTEAAARRQMAALEQPIAEQQANRKIDVQTRPNLTVVGEATGPYALRTLEVAHEALSTIRLADKAVMVRPPKPTTAIVQQQPNFTLVADSIPSCLSTKHADTAIMNIPGAEESQSSGNTEESKSWWDSFLGKVTQAIAIGTVTSAIDKRISPYADGGYIHDKIGEIEKLSEEAASVVSSQIAEMAKLEEELSRRKEELQSVTDDIWQLLQNPHLTQEQRNILLSFYDEVISKVLTPDLAENRQALVDDKEYANAFLTAKTLRTGFENEQARINHFEEGVEYYKLDSADVDELAKAMTELLGTKVGPAIVKEGLKNLLPSPLANFWVLSTAITYFGKRVTSNHTYVAREGALETLQQHTNGAREKSDKKADSAVPSLTTEAVKSNVKETIDFFVPKIPGGVVGGALVKILIGLSVAAFNDSMLDSPHTPNLAKATKLEVDNMVIDYQNECLQVSHRNDEVIDKATATNEKIIRAVNALHKVLAEMKAELSNK